MTDLLHHLDTWLRTHDLAIDLVVVWASALGTTTLSVVNLWSWLVLRGTHDATEVGAALKRKKAGEALGWGAVAGLFWAMLAAYYLAFIFGFYPELVIKLVLLFGVVIAAVWGVLFIVALRRADRSLRDTLGD